MDCSEADDEDMMTRIKVGICAMNKKVNLFVFQVN